MTIGGGAEPISSVTLFSQYLILSKHSLPIEYPTNIWQVSLQLICSDTHQIGIWFKESTRYFNSLRPRQNGHHFQTTFSNVISWMKMYEFPLRFHWSLFPRVDFNNIPALGQIMAWRRPGDKPLSEPMMVSLLTHRCATRPQWVNKIKNSP